MVKFLSCGESLEEEEEELSSLHHKQALSPYIEIDIRCNANEGGEN